MEQISRNYTTDEDIDQALREAAEDDSPIVVEAVYRGEPGLECLVLRWSDGQRMFIPRSRCGR